MVSAKHKKYLDKLKNEDPEFYKLVSMEENLLDDDDLTDEEVPAAVQRKTKMKKGKKSQDIKKTNGDFVEIHEEKMVGSDDDGEKLSDSDDSLGDEEEEPADSDDSLGDEAEEPADSDDSLGDEEEEPADSDDSLGDVEGEPADSDEESLEGDAEEELHSEGGNFEPLNEDDDGEEREFKGKSTEVSLKMVEKWKKELLGDTPDAAFNNVSAALLAAIKHLAQDNVPRKFSVKSPDVFNRLVRVSLLHMPTALRKMLRIKSLSHIATAKKFRRYAPNIKLYIQHLMELFECVTDDTLKEVVLRQGILPLLACFKVQPKQCRQFIKKLAGIWSTAYHKLRVIAFLAIFRLVKLMNMDVLDYTLKTMYFSYVQNCRFTTPSTLGSICFMRLSLAELYSLDKSLAYKHSFIYIRQMAAHLRNAIIANKKEKFQLVYNWQFIHCLNLWTTMLSVTHPCNVLEPLIYPVVQLALGTIKLQSSPRFHPLALNVASMLTDLSSTTGVFIPVLPILVNIYTEIKPTTKLKQGAKGSTDRLPNWSCVLKVSDAEARSPNCMRSLLKETMLSMVRYLAAESHSIAFPELVVPAVIALKKCEKRKEVFCQNFTRQLLSKIDAQTEFIEKRRQNVDFHLKDAKAVKDWETAVKQEARPMMKFLEVLQEEKDKILLGGIKRIWEDEEETKAMRDDDNNGDSQPQTDEVHQKKKRKLNKNKKKQANNKNVKSGKVHLNENSSDKSEKNFFADLAQTV